MKKKTTNAHLVKFKACMYFFSIVSSMGSIYSNLIIPIYYLQYLRNESADMESPWGSSVVPPLTAFFNECTFLTLPLMAWIIYRTIKNKHLVKRAKRRGKGKRRRANSLDSRRTTTTDFVTQANEELQPSQPLIYNIDRRRADSFDKTRESSTVRPTGVGSTMLVLETCPVDDSDDESITNLNDENMEKWKRHSSSLLDNNSVGGQGESDDEEDDEEDEGQDENPFLVQK